MNPSSESSSSLPERVLRQLLVDLEAGVYPPDELMPSMEQLAQKYDVSRVTLRNALQALAAQGFVKIRQGKGTIPTALARRRRRRGPPPNPIENFRHWKAAAKLPSSFPRLNTLRWDELPPTSKDPKWYMGVPQRQVIHDILLTASVPAAIKPRTVVIVTRGHGCTSLFRFIYKNLVSSQDDEVLMSYTPAASMTGRVIPIRINWNRLGNSIDSLRNGLESSMRWDILRELTERRWASIVQEVPYARIIGAIRPGVSRPNVEQHLQAVRALLPEEDLNADDCPLPHIPWKSLSELIPVVATTPIRDLIANITKQLDIKLFFMFDLSMGRRSLVDQIGDGGPSILLGHLIGLMKDLREHWGDANLNSDAMFSEMYFVEQDIQDEISSIYKVAPYKLIYPHFEQTDIFGVLERHYPPIVKFESQGGVARTLSMADLPAVLSSSYLNEVHRDLGKEGKGFQNCSIVEIVSLFEKKLLDQHFNRDWSEIPFHTGL